MAPVCALGHIALVAEKEKIIAPFELGHQTGHALGDLIAALGVSSALLCADPQTVTMPLGDEFEESNLLDRRLLNHPEAAGRERRDMAAAVSECGLTQCQLRATMPTRKPLGSTAADGTSGASRS